MTCAALLGLTACSGGGDDGGTTDGKPPVSTSQPGESVSSSENPAQEHEAEGPGGMAAELKGTLTQQGECWVVEDEHQGIVVPVFPSGEVTWEDDGLTYQGTHYGDGDAIELGGGNPGENATNDCEGDSIFNVAASSE
ncbi:hypothetical protein [Kytococcus sp. Marseille-QA3725]